MTEKQIEKDRQERAMKLRAELQELLDKHQFHITAEDTIGQHTAIKVAIQFIDDKKYPDADLAQQENPVVTEEQIKEVMQGKGDKI